MHQHHVDAIPNRVHINEKTTETKAATMTPTRQQHHLKRKDWQYSATFSHSMSNSAILIGFLFCAVVLRVYNCFFFFYISVVPLLLFLLLTLSLRRVYIYFFVLFGLSVSWHIIQPSVKLNFEFRRCSMCVFGCCCCLFVCRIRLLFILRAQSSSRKRYQHMMISKTISCARRKMRSH